MQPERPPQTEVHKTLLHSLKQQKSWGCSGRFQRCMVPAVDTLYMYIYKKG